MQLKEIKIGSPYLFKSSIYGDIAVHVTAVYGDVIHFTIDGGEAARQVRDFPELSDGKFYALSARIVKRPSRARKSGVGKVETPAEVTNTIRDVPGAGKVAVVATPPALQRHIANAKREKITLEDNGVQKIMQRESNFAPTVETF